MGLATAVAADPRYFGVRKCGWCHGKELMGDQVGPWRAGPQSIPADVKGHYVELEKERERAEKEERRRGLR